MAGRTENENTGLMEWQAGWKTRIHAERNVRQEVKREDRQNGMAGRMENEKQAERNCRQNGKREHRQKDMAGRMENEKTGRKEC
jgi:hypothetical protein